jgi:hypothetical protein
VVLVARISRVEIKKAGSFEPAFSFSISPRAAGREAQLSSFARVLQDTPRHELRRRA